MHHSSTCHPASCLRLLKYLALFRVLKSVGAAPFPETPSSPAAGVAYGNGLLFRDATFSQRADALTRQFLAMESLWPPVTEVTGATPMVFFHQRKAGGSSIRAVLHGLCTDANLHCFIICYDGINCDTYTLPTKGSPSAVYAGHIPWGEPQNKFERYWHRSSSNFSCVTNYREPVSTQNHLLLGLQASNQNAGKMRRRYGCWAASRFAEQAGRFWQLLSQRAFPDNVRNTVGSFHRQAR